MAYAAYTVEVEYEVVLSEFDLHMEQKLLIFIVMVPLQLLQ